MAPSQVKSIDFSIQLSMEQHVFIAPGILPSAFSIARDCIGEITDYCIIADATAAAYWLSTLESGLPTPLADSSVLCLPPGELTKSLDSFHDVVCWLHSRNTQRRTVVFLLGGGALLDLGGFVASAYMRGLPLVNIPTTFLAQVDAAVGGKVAVNLPAAKNLVGSFYYARVVIVDPLVVATQNCSQVIDGLAEAIKVGIIGSPELFHLIAEAKSVDVRADLNLCQRIAEMSLEVKIRLLSSDPLEQDLRRPLNLGHTLAHPLESLEGYAGLSHGQAVAIGIATAARYACRHQLCTAATSDSIISALATHSLPTGLTDVDEMRLGGYLEDVRRIRNGQLNFVVPTEIGAVSILPDVSTAELFECLRDTGGR